MCTAHQHHAEITTAPDNAGLSFHVEDMTCGHCAGVIKGAIEKTVPGAAVHADPASRTVVVGGVSDAARIAEIITAAGYTPEARA
ncbi:heavy-metal-associated domain-containing protein [Agrobacterium sp. SOY23]|uniref:heavy-metal-associated domain-containing protein n=1 Tax=Agrobacterium sp. SOY23 TaxID=3014555 RepID=UPI0022AF4B75|nr:heavy-metal-associated domain-containing protein [Agrobacterium sp. SOY23]MCZ4430684.1 heavy-metal-associated domain-containing protein [Agrobacterium sp. SOY23]